jgi:phosphatidylinositol alpha-1,6-mannosyltransferase
MTHLLVTNDFPPKVGGIQSYLWELWRRLPPGRATVVTTARPGAEMWDRAQPFPVIRLRQRVLWPTPALVRTVNALAASAGAGLIVLDPVLPLGLVGSRLARPYAVVVHGAEVTVPGRLFATRPVVASVLRHAVAVIAAGGYPAAEAARAAGGASRLGPVSAIPPGVDTERFHVLAPDERDKARAGFGLPVDGRLVVSISRLVPRKGFDVLIEAAARLAPGRPDLMVAVAGTGRDRARLARRIESSGAPVRLLGRVADGDLPKLYGCADVFAMLCRDRWAGLEREGFGIVFVEAAACGVPQVAGDSGGAGEAVLDGETGVIVSRPRSAAAAATALAGLLDDPDLRRRQGAAARQRVVAELDYDVLARRLEEALSAVGG